MERLTEYHSGVPVIKGKRFSEAARKLAGYEDSEELSKEIGMEKITTEFAEYICDMVCGNLYDVRNQEDADRICDECKLGKYICDICNAYADLNRFVGSQLEKQAILNGKLGKELHKYTALEEQGLLLKKEDAVDEGHLQDWYIHSVCEDDEPVWTEAHIAELFNDFILIPKAEAEKALAEMEK